LTEEPITPNTDEQPTSGAALRAKYRRLVTAPSGDKYLIRKPSGEMMIKAGVLPEHLVAEVLLSNLRGKSGEPSQPLADKGDAELIEGVLSFDQICHAKLKAALISPRIVEGEPAADDEINYDDIPKADQVYLYRWTKGEAPDEFVAVADGEEVTRGDLANFPAGEQLGESAGAGGDGAGVREESGV
jgi:hypothetical protein